MTTDKDRKRRGAVEGFSLTEFLVVMACAVILISATAPNIVSLQREWTLWGSARSLEASLQWGRMHAITANTPILFMIDPNGDRFYWVDPSTGDQYAGSVRKLPNGFRIVSSPRRPLRFYQHGNAAPAGTYKIQGATGSYSVIVSPGGRIRIQKP